MFNQQAESLQSYSMRACGLVFASLALRFDLNFPREFNSNPEPQSVAAFVRSGARIVLDERQMLRESWTKAFRGVFLSPFLPAGVQEFSITLHFPTVG